MEHLPTTELQETQAQVAMERIADHLLDQVDQNPLINDPVDKFSLAATAAIFTGSQRAIDASHDLLAEHHHVLPENTIFRFGKSLLTRGEDGPDQAFAVTELLPDRDAYLRKADLLISVAEVTDNEVLHETALREAAFLLFDIAKDTSASPAYEIPTLMLRFGIHDNSPGWITRATEAQVQAAQFDKASAEFLYLVADGLKSNNPHTRPNLVQAAIAAQQVSSGNIAAIIHNDFASLLEPDELHAFVRATMGEPGARKLIGYEKYFGDSPQVVVGPDGDTMKRFNDLVSELGLWSSPREKFRYHLRAHNAARHDKAQDKQYQSHTSLDGLDYIALRMQKSISDDLEQNTDIIDGALTICGKREDLQPESLRIANQTGGYFGWDDMLSKISHNNFDDIPRSTRSIIHKLRSTLPVLSATRMSLNVALFKSGDPTALPILTQDLTNTPDSVIMKPRLKNTVITRPNIFAYDMNLFWELADLKAEAAV